LLQQQSRRICQVKPRGSNACSADPDKLLRRDFIPQQVFARNASQPPGLFERGSGARTEASIAR
jgi:hypothetical protein